MSLWDDTPIEALIDEKTARFSAGLARKKLYQQLEEIRALPETPETEEATDA